MRAAERAVQRGHGAAVYPQEAARPPQHQRIKQLSDNNCLSCLVFNAWIVGYRRNWNWFIIKLVDHPRLCHGAVVSAEVEDSSRIVVSLNIDWGGWIRG